jgi:zinc transport system substrate-binding protein
MQLRRSHRIAIVATVVALIVIPLAVFLPSFLATNRSEARLTVVASFYPVWELTSRLVGPDVRVETLVPFGVEPHDWEPTPGTLAMIDHATLVVYIHPAFETYVPDLLAASADPPQAVVTSQGLDLLTIRLGDETLIDPHIWLDPMLAQHMVREIRDALIRIDPAHEMEYRGRADDLLAELETLNQDISQGLGACRLRTFVTSHAAFAYFARRYNLTMEAITPSPEAEPSPARIQELVVFARAHGITVVYTEPLVSSGWAETLAGEIGGTTLPLNPIEGISNPDLAGGPNYFTLMRELLANLQVGLGCG